MPILPGNQATSLTGQQLYYQLKADPQFYNILGGAAGFSTEPLLTVCNEILCRILSEDMPWKWNRSMVPPFLTVSLQQDYCTQLTDVSWLEDAWRVDINNSISNSNGAPKPIFALETVRDLPQVSTQQVPFNICYIFNSQAIMGAWQPNTAYGCGYGQPMTPRTPIQQFLDVNGNILYIDSTNLGLTLESPGYIGTTITPPGTPYPYGISGSTQPAAPANATPGALIPDGSVIWTVADPNGYAMRLSPLPALNGLCWWIVSRYQRLPQVLTRLQDEITAIPISMMYLFRQGVRAQLKIYNGGKDAQQEYMEWEETLMKAVRGADRQTEDFRLYPEKSIMGQPSPYQDPLQIGAAYPFSPGPWW
jgi:hypothetical protein